MQPTTNSCANVEDEDGWELISSYWWQTSFNDVSWACPQPVIGTSPHDKPSQCQVSPSSYSLALLDLNKLSCTVGHDPRLSPKAEILDLNADLVGVKGAASVVQAYEKDVGFLCDTDVNIEAKPSIKGERRPLAENATVLDIASGFEKWREMVHSLDLDDVPHPPPPSGDARSSCDLPEGFSPFSSICWSVSSTTSTSSVSGFTGSEYSESSRPSTLRAESPLESDQTDVQPANGSSSTLDTSERPSRKLNAAASSFVPTSSPPPRATFTSLQHPSKLPPVHTHRGDPRPQKRKKRAPTRVHKITNFSFPTLTSSSLPLTLQKDEQGFYTDVSQTTSSRGQSPALPQLLSVDRKPHRHRPSKTRAIVDRLRLSSSQEFRYVDSSDEAPLASQPRKLDMSFLHLSGSKSDDSCNRRDPAEDSDVSISPPSSPDRRNVDEGDEGWIHVERPEEKAQAKARRTRALCLALNRHRSSASSEGDGNLNHTDKNPLPSEPDTSSQPRSLANLSAPNTYPTPPANEDSAQPSSNDGWIGAPTQTHSRSCSEHSSSRSLSQGPAFHSSPPSPVILPTSTLFPSSTAPYAIPLLPAPPYYIPVPVYAPVQPYILAYPVAQVHMQHMSVQAHAQYQMQLRIAQTHSQSLPVGGRFQWVPSYGSRSSPSPGTYAVPPGLVLRAPSAVPGPATKMLTSTLN